MRDDAEDVEGKKKMSDHESAFIFGRVFDVLAKAPNRQSRKQALAIWKVKELEGCDFSDDQMHCDKSLIKLGLARIGVEPEFPEDGKVTIYGPVKTSKKDKPLDYTVHVNFKDPDMVHDICDELEISSEKRDSLFEFGEHGTVELTIDRQLNITDARFMKRG